ncbi:MAG: acetyl/propionyl/methylcrotonyl-CoA carboxylase subunit alpha [Caulobacteraceae bacterium]
MFKSILVANRGEIAVRIFATARRMGLATVAVYSQADAGALHVRAADRAVAIGPASACESYLVPDRIIAAAKESGADAVHPGYGFLSENAAFAESVISAGLVWVGPPPSAIRAMGLKDAAKALMAKAGVPVTPGYLGEDQSDKTLAREAQRIGFPVLIKAVAGGGGKGMRRVDAAADFTAALESARREAKAAFGDDRVLLETYVTCPRHIEVQVFGDTHGQIVHLFERDCSLQRRHQKVIEEAPAPGMDAATRATVTEAAVCAAQAVGYEGAGTVEFIADASSGLRADRIWFMEMNTRLQVEHPVTEAVTGLDLVEWQLRVAAGETLPLRQDQIQLCGHAVEARLYAENVAEGRFLPSTGRLEHLRWPRGVRIDTGVDQASEITPFYDPMVAKLIAHSPTREMALDQLAQACDQVEVWPVHTNAGFLARCLRSSDFVAGDMDTGLIGRQLSALAATPDVSASALSAAAQTLLSPSQTTAPSPWVKLEGFRLNADPDRSVHLFRDGVAVVARVEGPRENRSVIVTADDRIVVFERGEAFAFTTQPPRTGDNEGDGGDGRVRAPMPGKITAVAVSPGEAVKLGQPLLVLEAMKMEHTLTAPFDGRVTELSAVPGAQVTEGAVLVILEILE